MFKDVNIGGVVYNSVLTDDLMNKQGVIGRVVYYDSQIELEPTLSDGRMEQTFVHELLHAIFYEAGYEEQDEDMVNRLGKVLYQVLKDNPNLLERKSELKEDNIK